MLELKITLEASELATAINNLATAIANKPPCGSKQTEETKQEIAVTTPNLPLSQPPTYTTEQIMAAGATLIDAGKINELMELLHSFGVQAVMDLKPEQLGAFATAMRELGAKI